MDAESGPAVERFRRHYFDRDHAEYLEMICPQWHVPDVTDELVARDKCSLDLFWLRDESLLDADNLPAPGEIAEEIAEDLRGALEQIEEILGDLEAAGEPMR